MNSERIKVALKGCGPATLLLELIRCNGGVVEDEVLEIDQLVVDPQREAGIGEMRSFDPPFADG